MIPWINELAFSDLIAVDFKESIKHKFHNYPINEADRLKLEYLYNHYKGNLVQKNFSKIKFLLNHFKDHKTVYDIVNEESSEYKLKEENWLQVECKKGNSFFISVNTKEIIKENRKDIVYCNRCKFVFLKQEERCVLCYSKLI